ncbi:YcgN family cysteine cluster protein [Notoacmeibacter marinus]|uniref:YcgN family cysteine cluster protein n=1 Tax=Notoacmeibacter marinus TaxID=1876515 RepID=UPI003CCB7335
MTRPLWQPTRQVDMKKQDSTPFWVAKPLEDLTPDEWESLCDGCGKCCLAKLEDEDSGDIYWTSVGCRLFDAKACRCKDYDNRLSLVPDCVDLTPEQVRALPWLPSSCAYRLVAEGKALPSWHHLVCGDRERIHERGESVRGRVRASETELGKPEDYFPFVLDEEP